MKNQVLSIEQCKELVALGHDMADASMYYCGGSSNYGKLMPKMSNNKLHPASIPTYTLQDILDKLPNYIDTMCYPLKIQTYGEHVINFGYWRGERAGWYIFCQDMYSTLNSAFKLLKWCIENKYL